MDNFNIEEFEKLIKEGKVPDKPYFYKRSNEEKETLIKATKDITIFFKEILGLETYLIYGTLLGAIRDKDLIPYDYDIDLAYISQKHTKKEVETELNELVQNLKKYNLFCKYFHTKKGHIHIWSLCHKFKIDLWTSWVENRKYYLSIVINGELPETVLLPLKTRHFKNLKFNYPQLPSEILNFIYKHWRRPLYINWRKNPTKNIFGVKDNVK